GVYWLVEQRRSPEQSEAAELGKGPPERVDMAMPDLAVRRPDGSRGHFRAPERPTLVHFWATWCPPCRAELPGLLALPGEHPVEVVAIALDDDWADVERMLDRRSLSRVVLADSGEVDRALGIRTLPVTLLVLPSGRVRLRFDGARDWTD